MPIQDHWFGTFDDADKQKAFEQEFAALVFQTNEQLIMLALSTILRTLSANMQVEDQVKLAALAKLLELKGKL